MAALVRNMESLSILFIVLGIFIFGSVGCGNDTSNRSDSQKKLTGTIEIDGSSTV